MAIDKSNWRIDVFNILQKFKPEAQNAAQLIYEYSDENHRGIITEITLGVIRNSALLDNIIIINSEQPLKNIPREILTCLRIAVYELIYTQEAIYAVVNEAVNIAKITASKKAGGFVNAVLRKILSNIKNRNADLSTADTPKTVPLSLTIGCEFTIDILPDEKKHQLQYLVAAFSLPLWLVQKWTEQLGYEETKKVCFACNRRPSLYARPNSLKITADALLEVLRQEGLDCELAAEYDMVKINKLGDITKLNSFKKGLFVIQDITSASVVKLLNPQSSWQVFDICAAPGTKTTQLAELMQDKGVIIATDADPMRLNRVYENCTRLGIRSVKVLNYGAFFEYAEKLSPADAVLLDVPCSNTGVMAKKTEVRYRLKPKHIVKIAKEQYELLNRASYFVSKGGKICYSTCSILKEENSCIIEQFLNRRSNEFELVEDKLSLPKADNFDCDGGYAAILQKK